MQWDRASPSEVPGALACWPDSGGKASPLPPLCLFFFERNLGWVWLGEELPSLQGPWFPPQHTGQGPPRMAPPALIPLLRGVM